MPPDPKVHVGVAAIVHKPGDDSQVLMIRRVGNTGYAADGHDTWSVPGGWLEHGEFLREAVEREVAEETGVRVRACGQIGYVLCPSEVRDISIVTLFIKCDFVMGEPTVTEPDKCADVDWMPWSTVQDGRALFAPLSMWLLLNPLSKKETPLATPTNTVACPQETPHDEHRYAAPGLEGTFHCPGVSDQRSGDERRAAWDHPAHYGGADNPYEAIKVIEAWDLDFCLGNAVKYISRAGKKEANAEVVDLEKARWYIERRIEQLQPATE